MIKSAAVFFLTIGLLTSLKAQEVDSNLITRNRPGFMWFYRNFQNPKSMNIAKYDRLLVDVLYNDCLREKESLLRSNWKSIGFNVQSFYDIPLNESNTMSCGIGLGYGRVKMQFDYVLNAIDSSNSTLLSPLSLNSNVNKSVFTLNQIFIPIELRFRTDGWEHFKFQIGGRIGLQFLPKTHLFSKNAEGLNVEKIESRIEDFDPFLMSVHARIGIRNWALTASYNLNPYFKNKQSTQLNGLQLGLSISLF